MLIEFFRLTLFLLGNDKNKENVMNILKKLKILLIVVTASSSVCATFAKSGDKIVRMRAINIMPVESGTTSVKGTVRLQSESVPEIDFTYFLTDSIALELIAATATHSATLYNADTVNHLDLGEVSLLPPTLLVQYHCEMGNFRPYVGIGVNYTFFYGENSGTDDAVRGISYKNGWGWAAQVGADYQIGDRVFLNFDLKRIALSTDVSVHTSLGTVTSDLDINPVVAGLGVGYQF